MECRHYILMMLHAYGGKITNKTTLQKIMYFLSIKLDKEKEFGFRAHFYGPYSSLVEEGTDELVGIRFVKMDEDIFGTDSHGFPIRKCEYSITPDGEYIASSLEKKYQDEFEPIKEFAEKLETIKDLDYVKISLAAKAYFIVKEEGGEATYEKIMNKAKEFNWKLKNKDIKTAVDILKKIEFIKES